MNEGGNVNMRSLSTISRVLFIVTNRISDVSDAFAACGSTVNERVHRKVSLRSAFDAASPSVISGEARVMVDVERVSPWKVLTATLTGVAISAALILVSAEEELLNFRIEEVVERTSPSHCAVDLKAENDQGMLDPQLSISDRMNSVNPVRSERCQEADSAFPMNR